MNKETITFQNGFENWHETHFLVVEYLYGNVDNINSFAHFIRENEGTGGLFETAKSLTDEFEHKHLNKEWDGDFFDAVDEFLNGIESDSQHYVWN
jgi:hypothetical protein